MPLDRQAELENGCGPAIAVGGRIRGFSQRDDRAAAVVIALRRQARRASELQDQTADAPGLEYGVRFECSCTRIAGQLSALALRCDNDPAGRRIKAVARVKQADREIF